MRSSFVAIALVCFGSVTVASATPTNITVRVLAKDAKFIGSGVGGARIVISNSATDEILAEGTTEGSTGDTDTIMAAPRHRGSRLSSQDTAGFQTTLDIDEPVRIRVAATAPMDNPDSANTVTATQWLVPGKHIDEGDAWVLEMPGFSVDAQAEARRAVDDRGATRISVTATITMMCGCPVTPGGLWDADKYEIAGKLTTSNGKQSEFSLAYAGHESMFAGSIVAQTDGPYRLVVYAYDRVTGNTGVDVVQLAGSKRQPVR